MSDPRGTRKTPAWGRAGVFVTPRSGGVPWSGLIRGSWGTRGQLQRLGWGRSVGLTGLSEGKLGEDCGL